MVLCYGVVVLQLSLLVLWGLVGYFCFAGLCSIVFGLRGRWVVFARFTLLLM